MQQAWNGGYSDTIMRTQVISNTWILYIGTYVRDVGTIDSWHNRRYEY